MITGGITALKLAPKIAKNIKSIVGKEEVVKLSPLQKSKKTYRMRTELPLDTDIAAVEKQYGHLNFKLNPKPTSKGSLKGVFDAPIEHVRPNPVKNKSYPVKLTDDPKIRSQYPVSVMNQKFALENIDDPFLKRLGEQYGNQTYMGEKFPRFNKSLVSRLVNINRKKVGKELGVDLPLKGGLEGIDSNILHTLKRTNPDIELLSPNKRYLTRGAIKRNKTLNDYLSELDPSTNIPRYKTIGTGELVKDPRFKGFYGGEQTGKARLKATEDRIQEFRKKHGLELVINKFGREKGTGGEYLNINPKKGTRLYEAKRLFKAGKFEQSEEYAKRTLDTAKRSEIVMNAVLDKLSPGQREIALGMLDKGKPFMQALHAAAVRDKSTPKELLTPQAISTWYRNIMHRESESAIKQLLKEKARKGRNRSTFEIDLELAGWEDDMRALGLQSEIDGKIYGAWYDQTKGMVKPLVEDLEKEYPLKMMNFLGESYKSKGAKDGGLINGQLSDTSSSMPQGLPLLDPLESVDRSRRQNFAVGGFANLFGKLGRVPKAVGRFGDIKKPSLAKPQATTEVAVGQAVEDKPAMFLSTVNAIEEMPDAANMNAQQWLGTIRNKPGVSGTELDEFGLEALLTNMHKANPKQKLSKAQLIENYNREMPKIDMDIAIAEPVSRGADDITKMLLSTREGRGSQGLENLDIFSDDARLFTALHQPPQDRVGFVLRGKLIDIMRGANKTVGEGEDANIIPLLDSSYGGQSFKLHKGQHFKEMWENAFPNMFHTTNKIVKQGYRDELATLVPSQDVTKLSVAKNISEEQAFEELYQALNIFDRQVMTADVPIPFWTKKMLYRLGDMSEGRGFFYKSKRAPAHEGAQFIPGGSGYGEIKFYQNFDTGAVRAQEGAYKSGHFSGEVFQGNTGNSPFGWGRFSERIDENGRKILLMEEIQSDLHQSVAQKGYAYAPRLDKHDVLAEMGEFAKQLDTKKQTLESTRLRKEAIKQLPRAERESPANVAELKNIEKAIKKLIGDVKKLKGKVEAQAKATGRSGQVHPDTAFKKSENYAKLFMQGLMKMANDKGYDGVALSTGKMKKAHGNIPKGGDKFYDEIGVKAMQRMAKKSGFKFTDTTIVDGNGFTWEKIPLIELRDINTGIKIPGESTIPVYKKGGIVNKKMVKR